MNLTNQEQNYYELIVDMLDDGIIDDSERSLLNKKKDRYGLSDARSKEIEYFALQEIQNKNKPKFNTEGEEEYYELLEDILEDGIIDDSERSLLNKRKSKYGISDERAEEFEDYIRTFKEVNDIISNKKNADDLLEQGKSYINDENYEEAIKCFNNAIELDPNDWVSWHWLGRSYGGNGNNEMAMKCLKKAVELNPDDADNWYWLGYFYFFNIKDDEEGIKCLKKAVELNPDDADNWECLGICHKINENYEDAIMCFKKAVELNPNDVDNLERLGHYYYDKGNYEEAIIYFKKAAELNSDNARTMLRSLNVL